MSYIIQREELMIITSNWNEILASEDVNDMYATFTATIQLVLLLSLNGSLLGKCQTSHGWLIL